MNVDFWFDPSCPFSWLTSRWLVEVTHLRPVQVCWRVMSLSLLNEGRTDDPEGDPEGYLWVPARVCAGVQARHGHEALGRYYVALWTADGSQDWIGDLRQALQVAGLPTELAEAGTSDAFDAVLRASHAEGIGLVGEHVGTPIIAVSGVAEQRVAFFGPVISQVPRGEAAAVLWDGVVQVAATPGFHELRGVAATEPDPGELRG